MRSIVTILFLLLTINYNSLASEPTVKAQELIHHKNFKINPGKLLTLSTEDGDVVITRWHRNEIEVNIYGNENAKEKHDF